MLRQLEQDAPQVMTSQTKDGPPVAPTRRQLLYYSIRNGVPFVGFGFLDNSIMIIAGEYIDENLGVSLGISTMAAAGIGNWISDIAGLGAGGLVEASAAKLGLPDPKITWEQSEMTSARIAKSVGNMIGITIGCFLGLTPLLFY